MKTTKKPKQPKLAPSIDHLSDTECRGMLREMVGCVQSLGILSSTDVSSELVETLKKFGVEWDHDKLPEFRIGERVCLVHAHDQKGTVKKTRLRKSQVIWDADDSTNWNPNDELERV
jgi:hypothetical protein